MSNEENPPTCLARVWDNGDKTDCGKSPVLPPGKYCWECTKHLLQARIDQISEKENELRELYAQMNELTVSVKRALTWAHPAYSGPEDPNQ